MTSAERRTTIGIIIAVWLVTVVLWLKPGVVRPDGAGYLVYLPTTWLDRDLLLFDEWDELRMISDGRILHSQVTSTGHLGNHWGVGSAMFWYPAFLAADAIRTFTPFPRNGLSLPYNVAVVFASAIAGLLTLLAGMRIARLNASATAVTLAAAGVWLGTPLLWYSVVHATMSHAVSALACTLVVLGGVAFRKQPDRSIAFLTGAAAGFAFSARTQNAPIALVPALLDRRIVSIPYIAGGIVGAMPQLAVSTFLYGSSWGFVTDPSFSSFERIWTWEPILSWYHGLIPWSPFVALGIAGLVILCRSDRRLAGALLFLFAAEWFINATMERSFWGAHAFGQRRFDNCTVAFLVGGAVLIERIGTKAGSLLTAAASLWTMSIFFAARRGLDLGTYYAPAELWSRQLEAIRQLEMTTIFTAAPPDARTTIAVVIAVCSALVLLLAFLLRSISVRGRAVAAAVYLGGLTLFFIYCGISGRSRVAAYADLIQRNRDLPHPAAVGRIGLLQEELNYLRKSGRVAAAERTERDIEALRSKIR